MGAPTVSAGCRPSVSCIIPVHNGERFLSESLDSALAQTHRLHELIVVDDGSEDRTAAVAGRYSEQVIYARQKQSGAPAARNRGIAIASGEFVAFLDADDLWHESKLARQLAEFEARPALGCCMTYLQNFWMDEVADEARRQRNSGLAKPQPGGASTMVIRRRLFDEFGPLNADLKNRDVQEWMLRVEKRGVDRMVLSDVLTYRRIHRANHSRARRGEELFDIIKASLEQRDRTRTTDGR
ncbi:glycosyltransferase family A protein [soil metagenome]